MNWTNDDVVIAHGNNRNRIVTEGFQVYTDLIGSHSILDGYINADDKKQFVINHVIDPLLEEGRNFFDQRGKIDLSDPVTKLFFARKRVGQKIRDLLKKSKKRRRISNPNKPQREDSGHLLPSSPKKGRENDDTLPKEDFSNDFSITSKDVDYLLGSGGVESPVGDDISECIMKEDKEFNDFVNSSFFLLPASYSR
jgi:hypothetical protein